MRTAVLALLLLVSIAHASQELPAVETVRKIVTVEGLGTRTYWATGKDSIKLQSILKVSQPDGSETIYYVPASYHPNDFFRQDIETPVVVTGSLIVRDGKNYLFPYTAYEKRP